MTPPDGDGHAYATTEPGATATENQGPHCDSRPVVLPAPGYDVGELIGRGGMGEVVSAHDRRIDRDVAIKRMRDRSPSDATVTRFLREARIQARLDHPAIVPVHELGVDAEGRPFFTMKRLSGVTLAVLLAAMALYGLRINAQVMDARHELKTQAWHLEQLLPAGRVSVR